MSFLEKFANSYTEDEALLLLFFAVFSFFWVVFFAALLLNHFILAVPLCIMAEKAGYDYPFIAFIPFANYYLVHILPMKEYNFLGMFKTYERNKGFWVYLSLTYIAPIVLWVIAIPFSFIPLLSIIFGLIFQVLSLLTVVAGYIARAIMYIDLIDLYLKKENSGLSVFLGVASLFVFLMFPIVCIVICRKEPEFGFGNYYKPIPMQREED